MNTFELIDKLNGVIDQGKFIRNILVNDEYNELSHVKRYIIELKEMINGIKIEE